MSRRQLWAKVIVILGLSVSGVSVGASSSHQEPVQLVLSASLVSGNDVELVVRLRNVSKNSYWINSRFALNSTYAAAEYRDLWLTVAGPEGKSREFDCKIRVRLATDADYKLLRPTDVVERHFNLECFDLKVSGDYKIVAHYQDGNPTPPSAPAGARHLRDRIESQPVIVRMPDR